MRAVPWLAAAGFAAPALWAARDSGLAFDSQQWFPYGDALLRWLAGRGPWPFNPFVEYLEFYGPLAALGCAVTSAVLHGWLGIASSLVGHHVFIVLCGAALVGVTARLGADLVGPRAGVLAAALLASSPRFFAETQNNVSDLPAALAWTAALLGFVRALDAQRLSPLLGAGVAAGALGAIRLPNLLCLPLVPALWLALDRTGREQARRLVARSRRLALAGVAATAIGTFWLCRPLAWTAPRLDFSTIAHFVVRPPPWLSRGVIFVFFAGRVWQGGPPWYHAVMLALTTPLPVLAVGVAGARVVWLRQRSVAWLLAAWLGVSLGRHAALGQGNYNGVRHVIDAFPALAVIAAAGADAALAWLGRGLAPARARLVRALGTLALIAPGALAIWRLHPYPVTYYNALAGGLHGATRRFEAEYSGAVYRDGLEWAAGRLAPSDLLWVTAGPYHRRLVEVEAQYLGLSRLNVLSATALEVADRQRRDGGRVFAMHNLHEPSDERLPPDLSVASFPVVYEVRREGVPLLRIREVPASALDRLLADAGGAGR